ncbi:hypothetical protein T02_11008 [Trichinella nativa]|uniref:Uncharacterized protein n=1 Tax=Trichinella nativa TaxID=6335 RepID=A0A0V1KZV8_9BILA|nr:hypothetical protein T02_11008 [Trichinella nativa]
MHALLKLEKDKLSVTWRIVNDEIQNDQIGKKSTYCNRAAIVVEEKQKSIPNPKFTDREAWMDGWMDGWVGPLKASSLLNA